MENNLGFNTYYLYYAMSRVCSPDIRREREREREREMWGCVGGCVGVCVHLPVIPDEQYLTCHNGVSQACDRTNMWCTATPDQ